MCLYVYVSFSCPQQGDQHMCLLATYWLCPFWLTHHKGPAFDYIHLSNICNLSIIYTFQTLSFKYDPPQGAIELVLSYLSFLKWNYVLWLTHHKGPAAIYAHLFDTNDYFWPNRRGQDWLICTLAIFCIWFKRFYTFGLLWNYVLWLTHHKGPAAVYAHLFYTNDYFWPTTGGQVWLISTLVAFISDLRDFTLLVWCTCPMCEEWNNVPWHLKYEYSFTLYWWEMSFTSFLSRNP